MLRIDYSKFHCIFKGKFYLLGPLFCSVELHAHDFTFEPAKAFCQEGKAPALYKHCLRQLATPRLT